MKSVVASSAAGLLVLFALAAKAETIVVNVTESNAPGSRNNGNCSLHEALDTYFRGAPTDRCVVTTAAPGTKTITLPPGTIDVSLYGCHLTGITLVGSGTTATTLRHFGSPEQASAVNLLDGTVRDLSIVGSGPSMSPRVRGVLAFGTSKIERVRITGFNDSGVQSGYTTDTFDFSDDLLISDSTIEANTTAKGGGGLRVIGNTRLMRVTINNNSGLDGGGAKVLAGVLTMDYSTIASNTATAGVGGGVYTQSNSGAPIGEIKAYHVTIANNQAVTGGGGVAIDGDPSDNRLNASIVANNRSGAGTNKPLNDYRGRVRDDNLDLQDGLGPNMFSTAPTGTSTASAPGYQTMRNGAVFDFVGSNIGLGTLADNGGRTKTIALLNGSNAINKWSNAQADIGWTQDQRGVLLPRPSPNQVRDLGSYEK